MTTTRKLTTAGHPRKSPCATLGSNLWNFGFWAARKTGVLTGFIDYEFPHMRGRDFLYGSIWNVTEDAQNTLQKMRVLAAKDPNGVCTHWLGIKRGYLFTRPEDIQQLAALEPKLSKSPNLDSFAEIFGHDNILYAPIGHGWSEQRHLYNEMLLQKSAVEGLWENIPRFVEENMKDLHTHDEISLSHFFTHLAMDVIARTQLGSGPLGDKANELHKAVDVAMSAILDTDTSIDLAKRKMRGLPPPKRLTDAKAHLQTTFKNLVVEPNRKNISTTPNLLRSLTPSKEAAEFQVDSKLNLDSDKALSDGSFIFLAGHETTAKLMEFIIRALLQHPEVLAKLEAEFAEAEKNGPINPKELEHLEYLQCVINEVLRLFTPLPLTARNVAEECKLTLKTGRELTLQPGTIIMISPWITHRDEKVYERPNEFNPERWRTKKEKDLPKGSFIPFLLGRRRCPGEPTARIEAMTATYYLIRHFKLSNLSNKMQDILATKMKGLLQPAHPAHIRCAPR